MLEQTDCLQGHYDLNDSQMLKIEILPSLLPGAGMGLFAKEQIQTTEIISQYYGCIIPSAICNDYPFQDENKMVYLDSKYCVISRGPASRANDIIKWQPQLYHTEEYLALRKLRQLKQYTGKKRNAKIVIFPKQKAFIIATTIIKPKQQIYVEYGFQYWDFFLNNSSKQNQQ